MQTNLRDLVHAAGQLKLGFFYWIEPVRTG